VHNSQRPEVHVMCLIVAFVKTGFAAYSA